MRITPLLTLMAAMAVAVPSGSLVERVSDMILHNLEHYKRS